MRKLPASVANIGADRCYLPSWQYKKIVLELSVYEGQPTKFYISYAYKYAVF